ncbi:hypothetical protein [Rhodovibrio salinarum]|nr:hypothetical protein [Rhodovibrio salinarum]
MTRSSQIAQNPQSRVLGTERRGLFWLWGILAGIGVAVAFLGAPLADFAGLPPAAMAITVVGVEILLLVAGLGWLVRVVMRARSRA